MSARFTGTKFYGFDPKTGKPLDGGLLYTYQAQSNRPKATYSDEDLLNENPNPVVLNDAGYANVVLNGSYKLVLKNSSGTEVWTDDPVTDPSRLWSEWGREYAATQFSGTQFDVPGNVVSDFIVGETIQLSDNSILIGTVSAVELAGGNTRVTVVLDSGALSNSLTTISLPKSRGAKSDHRFKTIAAMVGATGMKDGDIAWVDEYASGRGPYSGNKFEIGSNFGTADNAGYIFDVGGGKQARALFPFGVWVDQFGAVGNAVRPSISDPNELPTGTDDTAAIAACRDFLQETNFQPNLYVGFWGGRTMNFTANKAYYVRGHNPLGSSRPRNDGTSGNPGQLARQNWRIEGNDAFILWEVSAASDCLIESHEAFTTQEYRNLKVMACNADGAKGVFFSNNSGDGVNAAQRQIFHRVEVYHSQPNSTVNGIHRMFQFFGDNLGDRLYTYGCAFNQAHTMFYSENGEAVQQSFDATTFASYLDDSIFFHLRRHGSGFNFGGGTGFLVKGERQTLFKTEFLSGAETGSNGVNTYMSCRGARLECAADKLQTIADCDFGVLEIDGVTMAPGGLPDPTSSAIVARKAGIVRVKNSHIHGRLVAGLEPSINHVVRRNYAIKLTDCQFSLDIGQNLFVEDAVGALIPWRDAMVGDYQVPCIVIEGTDTRTIDWQGEPLDGKNYLFDSVYHTHAEFFTVPISKKVAVQDYRGSSGFTYLNNQDYFVLPPLSVITSIKITHPSVSLGVMDTLRINVGSAQLDYALDGSAKRELELLSGQVIVISDDDPAERTIGTECRIGGGVWASPSFQGFLVVEYRPAFGKNEITTTESAGVRLSRIV